MASTLIQAETSNNFGEGPSPASLPVTEISDADGDVMDEREDLGVLESDAEVAHGQDEDMTEGQEAQTVSNGTKTFRQPKHDISALRFPLPFIVEMRQTLFDIARPVELKEEELEKYWPYIDNVWVRQHRAGADRKGNSSVDYYSCRLQRVTYNPKTDAKPADGTMKRRKRIREGGTCQARLKLSKQDGLIPRFRIQRIGEHVHSHGLEDIDKLKRNSVVMDIARSEVMKGFMPASVFKVLNEDEAKLAMVGGRYMTRSDVRNTSQAWRVTYTGKLYTHPGYQYAVGNGILPISTESSTSIPQNQGPPHLAQEPKPSDQPVQIPLPSNTLFFPPELSNIIDPYMPPVANRPNMPFVTLTYATSLDSMISLGPSIPTPISGPTSKAMTHYLRSRHEAIMVGAGTAIADDPTLNCRLAGVGGYGGLGWSAQPQPVIVDPSARWNFTYDSKILRATREGKVRAPWIMMTLGTKPSEEKVKLLSEHGGKFIVVGGLDSRYKFGWEDIFKALATENIKSVMIEGGGVVINDLLRPENLPLVDSVIITLAPTYLGSGGVGVTPARKETASGGADPAVRFQEVRWLPLGEDVVMCGRTKARIPSNYEYM